MRDVARRLHRKLKVRRRGCAPRRVTGGALKRVKRAVDLDAREEARAIGQFVPLPEPLGIKDAPPRRVAPTGDSDANRGHDRRAPVRGMVLRRVVQFGALAEEFHDLAHRGGEGGDVLRSRSCRRLAWAAWWRAVRA